MTLFEAGTAPDIFKPGDFLLCSNSGTVARVIRFGQRLRIPKQWCWCNHAAMVVSAGGDLVEALSHGPERTNADKYQPVDYVIVNSGLDLDDRAEAVRYANWAADNNGGYGYLTIVSIAFTLLTGARFRFDKSGTTICSGLVASALGLDEWRADPSHVMPAELAMRFGVTRAAVTI